MPDKIEKICHDEDACLDNAYSIFLELASDNLSKHQITLFNQHFAEKGVLELYSPFSDWLDYLGEVIDPSHYSEVVIGLHNDETKLVHSFAHILVPHDIEDKLCHVIWDN